MAITTLAGLIAAPRQKVRYYKGTRNAGATIWGSDFDQGVDPPAGTLAVGNTANGLVPDDTVTGFPRLNAFGGGNIGYLAGVEFSCGSPAASSWSALLLVDRLFHAGAYAFNAAVTLSAQPSYSARAPGGDYKGLQIWIEAVTAFTGVPVIEVTYTNQAGATGHTTGPFTIPGAAPGIGVAAQLPLQAGDSGVQKIESVTATVASAGTFNVLVLRPLGLWSAANLSVVGGIAQSYLSWDAVGLPQVFATSALQVLHKINYAGLTVELLLDIVNG